MSKNVIVISVDVRETRVALIENGIIAELHVERRGHTTAGSTVGNVYLGKVTRVLPGLQAAFIDIGQERAAFLHVEDLIRPADFEAYLQGGKGRSEEEESVPSDADVDEDRPVVAAPGEAPAESAPEAAQPAAEELDEDAEAWAEDIAPAGVAGIAAESTPQVVAEPSATDLGEGGESALDVAAAEDEADEDDDETDEDEDAERAEPGEEPDATDQRSDEDDDGADLPGFTVSDDLPGFTVSDPGQPVPRAAAPREGDRRRGRRRGRGRRGGERDARGGGRGERRGGGDREGRSGGRGGRDRERNGAMPQRLAKTTPIKDVVKEGQEVVVQVTKDPIGTKGARCSSHISLPGRYVVYLPTVDHVGISKRIGSDRERGRLREAIESMKPPTGGLIVRTLAEGLTKKQLKADIGYLVRVWGEIAKKREGAKAPALLYSELDIVLKTARDMFTDEVDKIVIDDKGQHERLCRFVEMFAPERVKDIELYQGEEPIFDEYGIEDEIGRALARKVPLPSGGYLIIDEAEALTAIDVNTGRFVGKGSKDMEETILKTNLEAVHEIAYQLRFRNIGGLIILDLIDMEKAANREKVRRTLEELLQKDKAKTTLNRISELGLIEMTRKRTRESLGRTLHEPCFYCDGTGQLQSKETIAYEILREIRRRKRDLPGYTVIVNAHPAVVDILTTTEKEALTAVENKIMRKINVVSRPEYHIEQFDLQGR
jgi:ribonuclease G